MNNDYCLQSYRNNYQGEGAGAGAGAGAGTGDGAGAETVAKTGANKLYWYQKTRIYKVITNPMFIVCFLYVYCMYQENKESHEESPSHNNSHCNAYSNSHFIIYGSSGSGKTSF